MRFFSVENEFIALPRGAMSKAERIGVAWQGRAITALSQGEHRAYLYPVFTPKGVSLTSESPIDHPHHQSICVGADHFNCLFPFSTDKHEEATYNFYVNETFQGRAPGRIVSIAVESEELAEAHLRLTQTLHWQGPVEWGAPSRRTLAEERRIIDIYPGDVANIIDLRSQLQPTEWDIRIGPTRHAYFTVRLADGLRVVDGGTMLDSHHRRGGGEISWRLSEWVDSSGNAPHGQKAGIAIFPYPSAAGHTWFVADWGTLTVLPFYTEVQAVNRGEALDVAVRIVAHDGDAAEARIADLYESFRQQIK